jgi:hypothetical protein
MKSKKKAAPRKASQGVEVPVPQQIPTQVQQAPMQIPQVSNAQQQQLYNYQQQQQAPQIAPNSLFTNAQQQMQSNVAPQQLSMQIPVQQMAPRQVGYYGNRSVKKTTLEQPAQFNDDEPFLESVKEVGKEAKVDVKLVAQRSQVKLGEVTVLPGMCQIVSSGGSRTSVDLICVIDVSGSMNGEKIELVKETMRVLI